MIHELRKYVKSAGAAYNLDLGFVPNSVETRNVTQWKQVSQNTHLFWNAHMADAEYYGYATQSTLTNGLLPVTDTSNGFTPYDTTVKAARQMIVTGVSLATRCIITVGAGHGLTAANDGDAISFNFLGSDSTTQLNGNKYTFEYINATTFYIDVNSTNFTAYSSTYNSGIAMDVTVQQDDTGFKGITLGSIVMANSADYIEVIVTFDDQDMPLIEA